MRISDGSSDVCSSDLAARIVRASRPEVRFLLLTRPEAENPTGYTAADLEQWRQAGLIEFLPETRDVRPFIAAAHAFVLPSFYREGLPRSEERRVGKECVSTFRYSRSP